MPGTSPWYAARVVGIDDQTMPVLPPVLPLADTVSDLAGVAR